MMITVADLVAFRLQKDPIVQRVETYENETQWGLITIHKFQNILDKTHHFAFQIGDLTKQVPLVRVHIKTLPDDLDGFGAVERSVFHASMSAIKKDGCGVLVFLSQPAWDGSESAPDPSYRVVGVGSQILGQLGITQMRLLTRQERNYVAIRGFGLDIITNVPFS
jgi:3,4-dihydroxy 2-butanone 4-phosphate synthase/GTP cyclohydrolase II